MVHRYTISLHFFWFGLCLLLLLGTLTSNAQTPTPARRPAQNRRNARPATTPADSLRQQAAQAVRDRNDSLRAARNASRRPTIRWTDRYSTRFGNRNPTSPFILRDPKAVNTDVRLDPAGQLSVYERIGQSPLLQPTAPISATTAPLPTTPGAGALPYRPAETVPFSSYSQLQNQRAQQSVWREYGARRDGQSAVSGRGLLPKLELPPLVDRLFGGSNIDFKPNGFVTLDFGYLHQFIDNPAIPVRQRRQGNFNFNEQININFNGQIGERLGLLANFDTKASFNFENALKLNYKPTGLLPSIPGLPGAPAVPATPTFGLTNPSVPQFKPQNENIIQNIEVGNLSWKLNSQLIPGVQNLFGLKTDLRFGKLNMTLVASQQRSKRTEITLRGGATNRQYEIRADQYDENRHFFLSQYFRSNYERALKSLPVITSGITITRLEVYVTNRTNTTETLRNVVGFSDLGENQRFNGNTASLQPIRTNLPADNAANGLYAKLKATEAIRQVDQTNDQLTGAFGLVKGQDFDLLRGAKRLTDREYKFQPELGYISLVTALRNDEVLAVSYEYTYNGQRHQVGELTEDYQNRPLDQVLVLKLLKSSTIRNNVQLPQWDLMMKNIYTLNTTQVARQGFQLRIIYKDDLTGIDNPTLQESSLQGRQLVSVFGMDRLNQQLDPQPDGNFDFVDNVTVDSKLGKVIFPILEPFGSYLNNQFQANEDQYRAKYVFNTLYRSTLSDAIQVTNKNKFFLRGTFQSATGQEVTLPYGVNAASVQVTAGGVPLTAGTDYVLEAQLGKLRLINQGITNSGRDVVISYEQPDLFQNQIRTLLGTHLDYALNPDISVGFTAMRLRETPAGYLTRVAIGNEPVNNTMLGANLTLRKDAPGLTRLLDKLPFLQTKEMSTIAFQGEVATLLPGVAPRVNDNSFIDDFEAARTIFDLTRQPTRWRLGATPQQFPQGSSQSPLQYGFNRARISVYTVDQTIYQPGIGQNGTGTNLTDADKQNVYERYFLPTDIFPGRSARQIQLPENVLDVAYFPSERGQYNYNTNLNADGTLPSPRQNFGAVTRAVASDIDFDNANIENITFWMLDPFVNKAGVDGTVRGNPDQSQNRPNTTGGRLVFNLGDISEDVIKDGRYNFENGLPTGDDPTGTNPQIAKTDTTVWGRVTRQQFVTNAFTNQAGARARQDVGLDGLSNTEEQSFFRNYLNTVRTRVTNANALNRIVQDPSADDFQYYLGNQADSVKYIVARYKQFMGMENNSPESVDANQYTTPASTNLPDIEDLNIDNTINDNEAYYEYPVDLRPGQLVVGQGYVVDKVTVAVAGGTVDWYQFRIPIRAPASKVGNINGFKSIRFMRMYLTDFQEPVVLRFAQLQMEANQYRKYTGDLAQRGLTEVPEPYDAQFKVATVNIEENSSVNTTTNDSKYAYTVPPGFIRDVDYTQLNNVQLNEQSMALAVTNLRDGDSRGAFRITNFDFLFRKRLKMFIHMHNPDNEDGQVSAFMRIGTDFTDNYYEVEIPRLLHTPEGVQSDLVVWPDSNQLDLALQELIDLKAARNTQNGRLSALPFSLPSSTGRYILTVVGNPDLSSVQTVMIGVRNPTSADQRAKTFTIWVDEFRSNGYDQTAGYAAIGSVNAKLADLGTVTASGRIQTFGFGGVQTKVGDRARDNTTEFGITSALAIDKLLPQQWGLRIPLYVNYDMRRIAPHFNPLDPDTPLTTSLATLPENQRETYRRLVEDNTVRRGINLSNVRKVKTGQNAISRFYDIENFAFSYAFNDNRRSNIQTAEYLQKQTRGGISYTFSSQPKPFEPFKNVQSLQRKYLLWLKEFNVTVLPTLVSVRTDVDRSFIKTQYRAADLTTDGLLPQVEKYFLFNRYYDLTWNLTRNLVMSYRAVANSIIDEPAGVIDTQAKKDSIWRSVLKGGRMKNFTQDINLTYRIPLDKFPVLDWIQADATYRVGYQFQANSYGIKDSSGVLFGNVLRNNRERGLNGRVDLIRLYNKVRYLRFANTPNPIRKNYARNPGDIEDIERSDSKVLKSFTRALLTVRGINFSYVIQESTVLPGFLESPRFFGLARDGAPGLGFVLGGQDRTIQVRAAERGWTSRSTVQNTAFQQTLGKTFTARTTLEPFKDMRIQVEARYTRADSYQEFYRPDSTGQFSSQAPVRNGQFSMSYLSFLTSFAGIRPDNTSPIFEKFETYRQTILDRLNQANPNVTENKGSYNKNSQDVLIPAFFAAYSGKDPSTVKLSPFYSIPLPNWRVDYNGLTNLPYFKSKFSSFVVTHQYASTYSVGNFTSSLNYGAQYVNLAVQGYPLAAYGSYDSPDRQFIPVFVMSTITLSERFSPLLGVQFQTKSRMSGRLEYNRDRNVALNLSNSQVAELTNKDITATIGFTRQNFRLPFRINGAVKRLKNDLTFQCSLTFRDTRSIQRKLDAEQIITAGNINFQLRPTVSYVVNKRLNLNFYFDRTFNDPLVSNSFRRATTAGGIQVKFNLAEL